VFTCIAGLMAEAGLTPNLQFGEYLWWFHTQKDNTEPGMAFYDRDTAEEAGRLLRRQLTTFNHPTDDPAVNSGADAAFLRGKLRDHVAALGAHIKATFPATKIEVLFPYDVNHPEPAGIHRLGGPLNRFVNFPAEWASRATCGFDRLKMEALDFGAWSRNLDLAKTAIRFPLDLGWPVEYVRHLVPIFRPGYAWEKEVEMALAAGIKVVNLWAYDHVCIYGWALQTKVKARSSMHGV
jgi:hypothetical protein